MPEITQEIKLGELTVSIDRAQITAKSLGCKLPRIPGFTVSRNTFVRPQCAIRTYSRVQVLSNEKTSTKIFLQYQAVPPWLEPIKLTVVTAEREGLQAVGLETIFEQLKSPRFLTVELALDFDNAAGIGRKFVLCHGLFGRSELVGGLFYKGLRYGGRHSSTMVRCYEKSEFGCFRVEPELHSPWLRKFGIKRPSDLSKLSSLLDSRRIKFVSVNWGLLSEHLRRKGHAPSAIADIRSADRSIHRILRYLRDEVGLVNVHRFLVLLPINNEIHRELFAWGNKWRNQIASQKVRNSR
jgi:hypothetical protein